MKDTISIKEFLGIIKKRWLFISIFTIVITTLFGTISYFGISPQYEASTQILVNQKSSNQLEVSVPQSSLELINTYSVIIKSPAILDKVIEKLNLNQTIHELNEKITVNIQSESQVFTLTIQDSRPSRSVEIANTISETFQKEIKNIMNIDNVNILARAKMVEDPVPVSPSPILYTIVGFIVGLMMGIGFVLFIEYLDNSLKSSNDVEKYLDLPVLGSVQKVSKQKVKKNISIQRMGVETYETKVEG
jgi:capsular polysaccharide biosynthesis protein